MASKVTPKEVIQFFKEADADIAELVLEFAEADVKAKVAKRDAARKNMAAARAAKGKTPKAAPAAGAVGEAGGTQAPAGNTSNGPIAQARARRAAAAGVTSVPAPAHTAAATSVESDTELGG